MEVKLPEPALSQPMSEHDGDGGSVIDFYTAEQLRQAVRFAVIENNRRWQKEMQAVMLQWRESVTTELARKGDE